MQGLTRRWLLSEPPPLTDESPLARLALPPLVRRILLARGFREAGPIERFCVPKLTQLHDPALLPGIDAAAERLAAAVRRDETIAIYGDYDVDGITATAILYHVIRAAAPSARLVTYVPHRLDEGYGLNVEALRGLRERGADLVVSVDCGITAVEPARAAREMGLDLVITDHHRLPAEGALPEAILVHPGLPGSPYPFADLCGAGVAFKLAWRFATCVTGSERVGERLRQVLLDMLPLAALGTIADVVPLVDENRILVRFGLALLASSPLPGVRALLEESSLAGERVDCEKVGFILAPRLNACGRMGHAAEAVRLLTDAPPEEARAIAARLGAMNRSRQETERRILEQAAQMAEAQGMTGDDRRAIVLAHDEWHPGVVGIVCSRLAERFGRPAILMQRQGEVCRGSARSVSGFDILDALVSCGRFLTSFGGHEAAAGLALETAQLEAFTDALVCRAGEGISVEALVPLLPIDCDACLSEIDVETVKGLAALAPFGRANRRPTVRVRGIAVEEPPRPIGAWGKHLSVRLRADTPRGRRSLRAVWWQAGGQAARLAPGMTLDVAIEPKLNEWNGLVRVEAELRDVCVRG